MARSGELEKARPTQDVLLQKIECALREMQTKLMLEGYYQLLHSRLDKATCLVAVHYRQLYSVVRPVIDNPLVLAEEKQGENLARSYQGTQIFNTDGPGQHAYHAPSGSATIPSAQSTHSLGQADLDLCSLE